MSLGLTNSVCEGGGGSREAESQCKHHTPSWDVYFLKFMYVLMAACELSLVLWSGATSSCGARASIAMASLVAEPKL